MPKEVVIQIEDARVEMEGRTILSLDHLEVSRGERVAVIGNSGSGKTTLMRMLKGYVPCQEGKVVVMGDVFPIKDTQKMKTHHRHIGMIHQHFDLIGRETVWQNVYHGRLGYVSLLKSMLGICSQRDLQICAQAIHEVHLEDKQRRFARTLSGGEQQRVAIARALAQEPAILLADEPVSSLDPALSEDIMDLLVSVCDAYELTLIMSLHLPELARKYADRILAMKNGKIMWDGSSDSLSNDRICEIYEFMGTNGVVNGNGTRASRSAFTWPYGWQGQPLPGG